MVKKLAYHPIERESGTSMIAFPKPFRKVDPKLLQSVREMPCAVCGTEPPSDPSHIKTVKTGGPDEPFNVFPMCRGCHSVWHLYGARSFLASHAEFLTLLESFGWYIDPFSHRLWHPSLQ